jgi:hypothetical protein
MFRVIDPNLPERNQEILSSRFTDVVEIAALAYAQFRYGSLIGRNRLQHFKPIQVRSDGKGFLFQLGAVEQTVIGRMPPLDKGN